MESNQPEQPNQQKGSNKTTATIIVSLIGIAVVVLVVVLVLRSLGVVGGKKDNPVNNGNQNVGVVNGNEQGNRNVNQEWKENTFINPLTVKLDDRNVTLKFPDDCTLTKDESKNRGGSFVSYYNGSCVLSEEGTVFFGGISFFSIDSINGFQDYSRNGGFWEGEWVSIDDYQRQKTSIEKGVSADDYVLKDFNGKNFLVRTVIDKAGAGVSRSYVTYIKDIRVQIYLSLGMPINQEGMIDNQKLEEYNILADKLFGQKIGLSD